MNGCSQHRSECSQAELPRCTGRVCMELKFMVVPLKMVPGMQTPSIIHNIPRVHQWVRGEPDNARPRWGACFKAGVSAAIGRAWRTLLSEVRQSWQGRCCAAPR